jgi:5,10-methenyltetrahydromethanopterin hydrogenase
VSAEELNARIERLTAAVEALPDPSARMVAEQLALAVIEMHGEGLASLLARLDPDVVRAAASEDDAVAGVLLLHGLHPVPVEERVIAVVGDDAELIGVADGVVTVRLTGGRQAALVEQELLAAVPDLAGVIVEQATGIALPMAAP